MPAVHTGLYLVPAGGNHPPTPATLAYDPADPYAVRLTFLDSRGNPTFDYTFARGLLADGLHDPAGNGDAHIGPHLDDDLIVIVVTPEPGAEPMAFHAGRGVIERFLDQSYGYVPMGREAGRINWDAELAAVLGGAS